MEELWTDRTTLLIGQDGLERLKTKHVLVVGLGGVGAYSAEMICRAGVGKMTIVDGDTVSVTNRNRQLLALTANLGKSKAELMAERLKQINPELELTVVSEFVRDEKIKTLLNAASYDYVVDAIDTLSPKLYLILQTLQKGFPLVSAMGAGGKTDPSKLHVSDISKTYNCRLAKFIRKRLHKFGITSGFKAVFSEELVNKEAVVIDENPTENKLSVVGTISYMPALFGCWCASVVLQDLLKTAAE